MKNTFARSIALGLGVVLVTSMALVSGGTATAGSNATASSAAGADSRGVVAQSPKGRMTSRVVGTTASGRQVTGKYIPLKFSKHNGHVRVRGLLNGVVHNANGTTRTFSVMRTMRVRSINGAPATARAARTALSARATCPILHLVLGPLDLDLLGLQVHLDRVVLNIDAQSGPGNLLGNLLCAVAGLLDGGLQGLLGRLVNLLNQILGQLGLGL
jgi:hypothetical protein